jgi:ketopantoate reductase
MRIVVVGEGVGVVGGYFGGALAPRWEDVAFVAPWSHLASTPRARIAGR